MDRNMLISNSKLTLSFIFDKVDLVFFEYMEKEIEWIVCVERERLHSLRIFSSTYETFTKMVIY